jgi:hypothetical protein
MIRCLARLLLFTVPLLLAAAEPTFTGPTVVGQLAAPPKHETSGLAASTRNAAILWTHDDSGGAPALYAVRTSGEAVATLRIQGEKNEDWEDVASYQLDGKSWLLIGDTGDNDAKRATVMLHVVEEPSLAELKPGVELNARPIRTLRVRYEDGARDCESVAVDPAGRAIYLLTKREDVPRLYRVDLEPKERNAITIARHVGLVPHLPPLTTAQHSIKGYLGKRRNQVTAMDFAPDGSGAVVLTYGSVLYFARRGSEPWADSLARQPVHLPECFLLQVEAACFSSDGRRLYLAAESDPRLVCYERN